MTGFEFVAKTKNDYLWGINCFEELLKVYPMTEGEKKFNKWLMICEKNPFEDVHTLFKDWKSTNKFMEW